AEGGSAAAGGLSPWELGLALVGRTSGAFLGIGPTVEARRRLGRYFAVVAELRLRVASRLTLFGAIGAGGHWAHLSHTNPAGKVTTSDDGGPSLSAVAGLLVRAGPGYVTTAIGYAWTPVV